MLFSKLRDSSVAPGESSSSAAFLLRLAEKSGLVLRNSRRRCRRTVRCWVYRSESVTGQKILHGWRKPVGMLQEHAHLPHLAIAQMFLESRHSGHADAAFDFDVGLPGLVVGHAHAAKHLRWLGKHAVGNHRFRLAGQTVANSALLLVNFCASQKIRLIRRHLRIRMRLLVEV